MNSDELNKKIENNARSHCDILSKDISNFNKGNSYLALFWSYIYIVFGLTAVISASVSAILTYFPNQDSKTLFVVALLSLTSSSILTFLNPAGRAAKRRAMSVQALVLLQEVKTTNSFIGLKPDGDVLGEMKQLSKRFALLINDGLG